MSSTNTPATAQPPSLKSLLAQGTIKSRFEEILQDRAPAFISSILNIANGSQELAIAEPNSIIMAAAVAATLNLPINPNLGFAYIVPYNKSSLENGQWTQKVVAQFQMGWKGFVQLAERTGQYKTIGAAPIRAGQLKKYNPLTSEFEADFTVTGGEIVGYAAYFKLVNGFEKILYWNVGEVTGHAKKYSKAYQYDLSKDKKSSPWSTNYDEMALKTLVKSILSKWGILSIEMEKAVKYDQAVISDFDGHIVEYADGIDVTNQKKIEKAKTETNPAPAVDGDL